MPPSDAIAAPTTRPDRSRDRLEADLATLSSPPYTDDPVAIRRYAWSAPYRATLDWLRARLEGLGFDVAFDPVGTLVARNRPPGVPVLGVGSHCDSNRNGGRFDGTLGVLCGLELARRAAEEGLDLPLQIVAFLEEEGSGFGQMLLGSRVMAGDLDADALATSIRHLDDGRTFREHALAQGLRPDDADRSVRLLDDVRGWIEIHIEQARVLEDAGERLGVVDAIAGYVHGDLRVTGVADHAGATPMTLRHDAALVLAACALELERLALSCDDGTVATAGEWEVRPGLVNVVPDRGRMSFDVRGPDDASVERVVAGLAATARAEGAARGVDVTIDRRQTVPAVRLDAGLADLLAATVAERGVPWRRMTSGAAHDTMNVARCGVPAAMLFIPCRAGISHDPSEWADVGDAVLAVDVALRAGAAWLARGTGA